MKDWTRHDILRYDRRLSVKEGTAALKDAVEADPVNDVPIAGFTRPLPVIEEPDPFGLKG